MIKKKKKNTQKSSISKSYKFFCILGTFIFSILFSVVFLYQPAKNYYLSVRELQQKTAQEESLEKTNKELKDEIDNLSTKEGVVQHAKDKLNLIESGESSGSVEELNNKKTTDNSSSTQASKLSYKQIKAPTTWYSPFLDYIFDYN